MDYYNGIVKLRSGPDSGVFTGEVPKSALSVPEILVLKKLHGADAVVIGEKCDQKAVKHSEERQRLASTYGPRVVNQLFGEPWQKLPIELPRGPEEADLDDMAA